MNNTGKMLLIMWATIMALAFLTYQSKAAEECLTVPLTLEQLNDKFSVPGKVTSEVGVDLTGEAASQAIRAGMDAGIIPPEWDVDEIVFFIANVTDPNLPAPDNVYAAVYKEGCFKGGTFIDYQLVKSAMGVSVPRKIGRPS